jgi:hypothetical protein
VIFFVMLFCFWKDLSNESEFCLSGTVRLKNISSAYAMSAICLDAVKAIRYRFLYFLSGANFSLGFFWCSHNKSMHLETLWDPA